jgi:pyruvate/2-oxoglutarate dehydrogenase complex dihydrolipoamide acyltransferase (E2) component
MMPRRMLLLVSFPVLLCSAPGHADVSEFASYDECILESLKGVSSDVAANAIIASCRSKFPQAAPAAAPVAEPVPEPAPAQEAAPVDEAQPAAKPAVAAAGEGRELTKDELGKLKATLFALTTKYKVTFENLNDDITVTEVTIAVWDDFDPRGLKKYTQTMHIPPSAEEKVEYEVIYMGDDQGWRWKVDSAKGVPTVY